MTFSQIALDQRTMRHLRNGRERISALLVELPRTNQHIAELTQLLSAIDVELDAQWDEVSRRVLKIISEANNQLRTWLASGDLERVRDLFSADGYKHPLNVLSSRRLIPYGFKCAMLRVTGKSYEQNIRECSAELDEIIVGLVRVDATYLKTVRKLSSAIEQKIASGNLHEARNILVWFNWCYNRVALAEHLGSVEARDLWLESIRRRLK